MHRRDRARAEIGGIGDVDENSLCSRVAGDGGVDVGLIRRRDDKVDVRQLRRLVARARHADTRQAVREIVDTWIDLRRHDVHERAGANERLGPARRDGTTADDERGDRCTVERNRKRAHRN